MHVKYFFQCASWHTGIRFIIKAALIHSEVYLWEYYWWTDSGRNSICYLAEALSCVCLSLLQRCEMIDNSWHTSWHLCVDRWPSGCTGWRQGYGTAVQGALLGSAAWQCDAFPYGCLILSGVFWAKLTHTGKTRRVLCVESNWTLPVVSWSLSVFFSPLWPRSHSLPFFFISVPWKVFALAVGAKGHTFFTFSLPLPYRPDGFFHSCSVY